MEEHIMNQLILEEVLDYLNFKLDEVYKENYYTYITFKLVFYK